ncbi:MAG: hypothetical protein JNN17_15790 [Verrucomicrobiaceae bacterium]|nr:hypothetical protein [Verrucomicrobiaceae bacterium]
MPALQTLPNARRRLMVLWALSGLSTLTLELVWMRQMALYAGSTVTASTLVTTVFFACAAFGNLFGSKLAGGQTAPLRLYARFEVAAGLAAIAGLLASRLLHEQPWILALVLAGPASFCSGVAFPSLTQAFVPDGTRRTASAAPFYALNLIGAAIGVAAGGVLLPFWLGLEKTFYIAAALQVTGGLLASSNIIVPQISTPSSSASSGSAWPLLAASGLLSLATQSLLLTWTRQVMEGSIYAMSAVLMVFIGGLGLGALAAGYLRQRGYATRSLIASFGSASTMLLITLSFLGSSLSTEAFALSGETPLQMLFQAMAWCTITLLPLTFSIGGLFPLAWELAGLRGQGEGRIMGTALAVNKLASAAGAAVGLFVLLPLAGLVKGTLVIAAGYALAAMWADCRAAWLALPLLIAFGSRTHPPALTPEVRLIASTTGAYGPVSVVEDVQGGSRHILLNSRQRLSGTRHALRSQHHQSWLPLMLCRKPERVFTLGMAAGISAAAALDFPIRELQAVELVPEVVDAARDHFGEWNAKLFNDARARVIIGDGRHELAKAGAGFDAIIADLFFPAEEGTAHLYSHEFFTLARSRLTPGGVFCLWLPCYQLTPQTGGIILRTFTEAFPCAIIVRGNFDPLQPVIGLIGSNDPLPFSREHFSTRLAGLHFDESPFLRSADHALLMLVGDLHAADPDFNAFTITTDDAPVFAFWGPRAPRSKEQLIGFPFLDWIGKRFLTPSYPSCDLGSTSAEKLLASLRAANFYQAAATSNTVLESDTRPPKVRERQVRQLLQRAAELTPDTKIDLSDLGR